MTTKELIDQQFEKYKVKKLIDFNASNNNVDFLLIMSPELAQLLGAKTSGLLQDANGVSFANAHFCYKKNKNNYKKKEYYL